MILVQAKLLNGRTESMHQAKPARRNLAPLQVGQGDLLSKDAARHTLLWSKENEVQPSVIHARSFQ